MKILTSGCSFTHAKNSWANQLKLQGYDLTNVAEGGGGNEMNTRNIIQSIHTRCPDIAILQISGIDRYELMVDGQVHFESDAVVPKVKYTWIKSTGDIAWANGITPVVSKPLQNYMKYCYNHTHQILRTLHCISNFQDVCDARGVVSKCFLWQKVFNTEVQGIINNNEELKFWYQKIDWDKFWFHKDRLGLSEWGIDNGYTGDLDEDKINYPPQGWYINDISGEKEMVGHPSTKCHQMFAEKVAKKWFTA